MNFIYLYIFLFIGILFCFGESKQQQLDFLTHFHSDEINQPLIQNILYHIESFSFVNYFSKINLNNNNNKNDVDYYQGYYATVGSKKLANDISLLKYHIQNRIPLILIDVDQADKQHLCAMVNGCFNGTNNILAYIPRETKDGLKFHRIYNWMAAVVDQQRNQDDQTSDVNFTPFNHFTGEFLEKLVGDSSPISALIPPSNTAIPFSYYETSVSGSFNLQAKGKTYVGPVQTFSNRIDNHVYLYKDVPDNLIYFGLLQNSYAFPGSPIGINDPTRAIGYFQTGFSIANSPSYNGAPLDQRYFNLEQTSPATVNQAHQLTNTVSTSFSVEVSFSIGPDGPSGGAGTKAEWSSTTTDVENISDWGINEMTNPSTMKTQWMFHQQFPYDPETLGYANFGSWWQQAYSNENVKYPPSLSTNTLQATTLSVWKASTLLVDPSTQMIVMDIDYSIYHAACMVVHKDTFYDSHHKLFYSLTNLNEGRQSVNLNYFPNH
ncbi:hypothetical protein CYY_003448 [Polysphondylium violaceum]|uniref:Uncharacterized protein n=1 Tax=Polysphondylium violaceum TaxID=133409 RepID=A0A8J4PXN1_9MYCE|nr:hypothetical protein CYY_003448 [Polysphondylium violaceum]